MLMIPIQTEDGGLYCQECGMTMPGRYTRIVGLQMAKVMHMIKHFSERLDDEQYEEFHQLMREIGRL
jgi:hypothetical protein